MSKRAVFCLFLIYFVLTLLLALLFGYIGYLKSPLSLSGLFVLLIIYCLALFFLMNYLESFRIGQRRILDLGFGFFAGSLGINLIAWIMLSVFIREYVFHAFVFCLLLMILQCLIGLCWILLCHRRYEKIHFRREAIFIYGNREDDEYIRINNTINRYFKISKTLQMDDILREAVEDENNAEETFAAKIVEVVSREIPQEAVVFLGDLPTEIRNPVLKYCLSREVMCYSVPKISDIYLQNAEVMQLNDKLLFKYPSLEITGGKRFVKRSIDVIGCLILLGIFGIPMLIIAQRIRKEDGGPALFYQDRITLNGKPFQMIKFRSMRTDAEEDGARLMSQEDDRITKIGRKLRNSHMDELPQLINVLRGEMSLVGPRPERQDFADFYQTRIPEFSDRLKVKGGLTGYAQIYGKYNTAAEDKIKYDLYYIYNHSIKLDIKILILTVRILFQKENTEGIPDGEIYAIRRGHTSDNPVSVRLERVEDGRESITQQTETE